MSSAQRITEAIEDPHAGDYDPRQRKKTVVASIASSSQTSQGADPKHPANTTKVQADKASGTGGIVHDPHSGDYDPRRK